jgi:glycosyltransferase involved in cell wall biosynthesis
VKVSIVIPTRDRLSLLRQSLQSARLQAHGDLEILVSDDGSTDGTREYLQAVAQEDQRVRVSTINPTPGAFANIRHLINEATGVAIAILGDDDILEADYIPRLAAGLLDPTVTTAYCRHDVIDGDGRPQPRRTARVTRTYRYLETSPGRLEHPVRAALLGQMWLGSCLFRTSVLRATPFDPACGSAADWDLAMRMASTGASYYVPDVLWHYRDHARSITRVGDLARRRDAVQVLEKHGFDDRVAERLRLKILQRRLIGLALALAEDDRMSMQRVLSRYLQVGGSRLAPGYLGALVIQRLPRRIATSFRREINNLRGV